MAKIKKYPGGGNVKQKNAIDSTLLRKYNPKDSSVVNKPTPTKRPASAKSTRSTGYYDLRNDYAQPGARQREAEMVKQLTKKGPVKRKGGVVKKAQDGTKTKVALRTGQLKRLGRLAAKNPDRAEKVGSKMVERATRRQRGKEYIQKNLSTLMPQSKKGSTIKKSMGCAKCGKSMKKK